MSSKRDGVYGLILLSAVFSGGYLLGDIDEPNGIGTCWDNKETCVEIYQSPADKQLYSLTDGAAANCQCINIQTRERKECHHDRLPCDDEAAQKCKNRFGPLFSCAVALDVPEPDELTLDK